MSVEWVKIQMTENIDSSVEKLTNECICDRIH